MDGPLLPPARVTRGRNTRAYIQTRTEGLCQGNVTGLWINQRIKPVRRGSSYHLEDPPEHRLDGSSPHTTNRSATSEVTPLNSDGRDWEDWGEPSTWPGWGRTAMGGTGRTGRDWEDWGEPSTWPGWGKTAMGGTGRTGRDWEDWWGPMVCSRCLGYIAANIASSFSTIRF